jgi:hypothetical protein
VDSLNTPRCLHQATVLGDGKILISGGWGYNHPAVHGDFNHGIRQAEIYQAVAGTWTTIAPLNNYRREHTTTTLANGNVLVAGGYGHTPDSPYGHTTGPITKAEILNLSTGVWSETAAIASPRYGHTAIALKNGKILMFGAYGGNAEVYAPDTGSWSSAGVTTSGGVAVGKAVGTRLQDGRVIVTGSSDGSAQLYDPVANAWSTTSPGGPQGAHTATLLPTGKVLTLEGYNSPKCVVYDPLSNSWTPTGSPLEPRYSHSACLLPSGKVLICGGLGFRNSQPNFPLTSVELYDPATGKWKAASPTGKSRYFPSLIRIGENRILATGGENSETSNTAEIYDETSNSWTPTAPLLEARSHFSVTPWDGGILATGGMGGFLLPSVEVFDPPFPEIAVEQPDGTSVSSSANKNFGTVGVGSTKAIQFTVLNEGTSSLTGLTVTRSGANAGEFGVALQGSGRLAPGAGTILTITFKPTAVGAKSAILTLVCNDGREHPFVIGLKGRAVSPRPEISVQQPVQTELSDGKSKISFGTMKVSKSGSAKTFVIKNTGTGKLSGLSLKTDGNHPKDYNFGDLEKTSLAPGASTSFKVTFKPTKKGTREAWVHVKSNDANEGSFDIKLTGLGAAN